MPAINNMTQQPEEQLNGQLEFSDINMDIYVIEKPMDNEADRYQPHYIELDIGNYFKYLEQKARSTNMTIEEYITELIKNDIKKNQELPH